MLKWLTILILVAIIGEFAILRLPESFAGEPDKYVKPKVVHGEIKMQHSIRDMDFGEIGYTKPWAFDAATGLLDISYLVDSKPDGTDEMRVERTKNGF